MDVSTIITRMAQLSLDEDTVESGSDKESRLLGYINLGYRKVLQEIGSMYTTNDITSQSVVVTSGSGTISTPFTKIVKVVDTDNETVLTLGEIDDIIEIDPKLANTGSPTHYYITSGNTLNTYPKDSITATVWYIPQVADLTITSTSSDIKIPFAYQDILVEAGLQYLYVDERDLTDAATLNNNELQYQNKLSFLKQFIRSTNQQKSNDLPF